MIPLQGEGSGYADTQKNDGRPLRVLAHPALKNSRRNPYNWLLTRALLSRGVSVRELTPLRLLTGDDDIWHLHWPEGIAHLNKGSWLFAAMRAAGLVLLLRWGRWRGKRIVWTVHNLGSHEQLHRRIEARFWHSFTELVDGFISLSEQGAHAARERFPTLRNAVGFVVPHGHYRDVFPATVSKTEARQVLRIDPHVRVIAYIGQIRPYKNVPLLISAFRKLVGADVLLLIAGSPLNEQLARELREAAADAPRVRVELKFLSNNEIQHYVSASDLIVLPYREILNSGTAVLALSLNRPVLVPRLGGLAELQALVGKDWVCTYDGPLTAVHLERAVQWAVSSARSDTAPLQTLDWNHIAAATIDAYGSLINGDRAHSRDKTSRPATQ
jgi:glycosyltransferase involved in cell wall biosynthesis